MRGECLPVVFGLRHDDAIDEYAGYLHLARIERAAFGDAFDLRDDDAAGIARRHGDGQRLQRQRFLLHGQIAVGIACCRADDADMDRETFVEKIFRAVDFHDAHDVFRRARIELAAAVARIDEGSEADARDMARPVRRDVTEEVRDHALRQIIGLDLVLHREALDFRDEAPMAADHAPDEAGMAEMIEAAFLAVALASRVDEREIARMAGLRAFLVARAEKSLLQRDRDLLGETDADEAAGRDRVAVAYEFYRIRRGDDLSLFVALEKGEGGMFHRLLR